MRKFVIIAALGLSACEAVPDGPVGNPASDPVRINFTQQARSGGGQDGCRIGISFQYPAAMESHARRLTIVDTETGEVVSQGPETGLPLPRPAEDPRAVPGSNGSEVFSFGLKTIYPCRQLTYEATVGPCASGTCRDWLVSADDAPAVTLIRR